MIAKEIDPVADRVVAPKILAHKSGHLREVRMSRAFRESRPGRLMALDRDAQAIATVAMELADPGLTALHAPSYAVLHERSDRLGRFDSTDNVNFLEITRV